MSNQAKSKRLYLRIERPRKFFTRLDQGLRLTRGVRNEAGLASRQRGPEADISFSTVIHRDRPGMQPVVRGDGVDQPTTVKSH